MLNLCESVNSIGVLCNVITDSRDLSFSTISMHFSPAPDSLLMLWISITASARFAVNELVVVVPKMDGRGGKLAED